MSDLDLTLFIRRGVEYPRTRYAGELQGEILLKEQMAGHETQSTSYRTRLLSKKA